MTADFVVTVELVRPLSRQGILHERGEKIHLTLAEADHMVRAGFAKPVGAPGDWGIERAAAWVKAWRAS